MRCIREPYNTGSVAFPLCVVCSRSGGPTDRTGPISEAQLWVRGGDGPDGRGQAPAGSKRVEHRRERERPETRRRSLRVGLFGGSVEGWRRYLRRRVEISEKFAAGGAAVVARAGAETDGEPPTALPRDRRRRYRRGDRRTARGVYAHERTGTPPARSEAPKDQRQVAQMDDAGVFTKQLPRHGYHATLQAVHAEKIPAGGRRTTRATSLGVAEGTRAA